jgi:MFS family permease
MQAAVPAAAPPATNRWLVLVLVCVAQFMVVLDATIVNVALPSIQSALHFSPVSLQWIVNAYTLVFGGFLLLGGRAADLLGRQRLFIAGIVVFTLASLLNGIAPSSGVLIAGRALQGLGAALVSPAALSIVMTTFDEGRDRTKALGVWSAIAAGGGAVGLVLGGLLTDTLSWRWVFFINLPIGIAAALLSLRYVPNTRAERRPETVDLGGAVSVTAGPARARVQHRQGAGVRVDVRAHVGDRGARSRLAGRVRRNRVAFEGAADPARDLPGPLAHERERVDAVRRLRSLRDVSTSRRCTCRTSSAAAR